MKYAYFSLAMLIKLAAFGGWLLFPLAIWYWAAADYMSAIIAGGMIWVLVTIPYVTTLDPDRKR
jgi:hypothetical protein